MISTIETGFRISEDRFDLSRYWDVVYTYKCNHIQIHMHSFKMIQHLSKIVRENLGSKIELSYFLDGSDPSSCLVSDPNSLFQAVRKFNIKYLVVTNYLNGKNGQDESTFLNNIESLLQLAEQNRAFLCLENTIDNERNNDWLVHAKHLKELFPSRFLLFSLSINNLTNAPLITSYTKTIRSWIATINVNVNLSFSRKSTTTDLFVDLINHLYWLPYKQQPLIFTNHLEELESVYKNFWKITEDLGLEYP